ncbi:DUF3011 domain-containing protein [Lysobacter niabensis]|uniref:DUF3011 domain-containing protein n=1 Tax=Agrilutibacter niabensis TaxID=380628 RepID=UPI003617B22F
MKKLLEPLLAAFCLLALSTPALAAVQARAYAPEDLRSLSYDDQARVIRQEYMEQSGGRRIADDQLRFYLDQVNRSNWRFSDIKRDIATSLGGSTGPVPGGAIRCESTGNRSRTCRTPWMGDSRLGRQLSSTQCLEGHNWRSQDGQVTVWGGCRAEFVAGDFGGSDGNVIVCESVDKDSRRCATPWRGPSRLVRQLSGTTCIEGRNWGSENGEVIVWSGCRGEFARGQGQGGGQTGTVRCESANNRVANCRTPWRGASTIVRQLSDTTCREGQNWDSGDGQLIVWSGCRAEFGPAGGGWNDGDNGNGNGNGNGYTVTCSSQNGGYTTCNWPPGQGRPRLLQQLSHQTCVQGRTWGMAGDNRIWVDGGCRARFGN